MLTERSIINFLIWIGGLIIGPYLAYSLLWGNLTPVLLIIGAAFLFFMFAIAKDMLCIAPLMGTSLAGTIMFLPGKPDGFEFAAAAAILFYLITYAAMRRTRVLVGPLFFFIPIMIVAGIVFCHDPQTSLRLEGGDSEGGRKAVDLLLGAVSYVCCVSMNSPSARFFARTPIFCILASLITGIPYIITTYFPKASSFFYLFTNAINMDAYVVDVTGAGADIVRSGSQGSIGASIVIFLLCYYPIHTWWRPDRWWIALLSLVCTCFVVLGGFRSEFVIFVFTVGMAIWCHSSWRTLILVPPLVAALAVAVGLQNSHLVHLPEAAQRTLAFLPGDWDSAPLESTKGSNNFRDQIRTLYLKEDAGKSPWFGNGMTYDSTEFARYNFLAQYYETPDHYYGIKTFVVGKLFHIGWISVYDAIGGVGSLAMIAFATSLIWSSGRMIFGKGADRNSPLFPLKIWIFSNVTGSVFGFLTVFGDFKTQFVYFCVVAIVWTHISRLEKFGYHPPVQDRIIPFDPDRANLAVPAQGS